MRWALAGMMALLLLLCNRPASAYLVIDGGYPVIGHSAGITFEPAADYFGAYYDGTNFGDKNLLIVIPPNDGYSCWIDIGSVGSEVVSAVSQGMVFEPYEYISTFPVLNGGDFSRVMIDDLSYASDPYDFAWLTPVSFKPVTAHINLSDPNPVVVPPDDGWLAGVESVKTGDFLSGSSSPSPYLPSFAFAAGLAGLSSGVLFWVVLIR